MKRIILSLSIILLISCNSKTETVKGDLYFKLVNMTSPKGMSKQEIEQLKQSLNNFKTETITNIKEKELINYFKKLEEQQLLGLPYIIIKEANGETKHIILSKKEYGKIKNFSLDYLQTNHKKVTLELELTNKDSILYSDNIIRIEESDGETFFSK